MVGEKKCDRDTHTKKCCLKSQHIHHIKPDSFVKQRLCVSEFEDVQLIPENDTEVF